VTDLEAYLKCGWHYYQSRVLRLGELSEPEEDAAPNITGSIVHRVFQRFHEAFPAPVTKANAEEAHRTFTEIADEEFGRLPVTLRNKEAGRRFISVTAPGFIRSEVERAESGFRTLAAERKVRMDMGDGVIITGKLDRIDVTADGRFEVVDYKTGRYPTRPADLFQLQLYALMACKDEELAHQAGTSIRPAGLVYYNLKDGGTRDVVVCSGDADEPDNRNMVDDMGGYIAEAEALAREAIAAIRAGEFGATCKDNNFCENYCEFLKLCERGSEIING
jgi:RecB family exonuclease